MCKSQNSSAINVSQDKLDYDNIRSIFPTTFAELQYLVYAIIIQYLNITTPVVYKMLYSSRNEE